MSDQFKGVIERVTFHNLDTGFAVLRVLSAANRGVVTVTGHLPNAIVGEYVEATGSWVQNRDYGLQFKSDVLRTTPPHTVEGIARYLGSGLVKGVGPHFAKKIVEVFGERTLTVIDESPDFLQEVKGIGPKRIQLIRQSWQEQKAVRSIMIFLQSHGIGTARAVRIYKTYGDRAIEVVRANPYRLASDVLGIGFETADKLALELGLDRNSVTRAQAAIRFVLQEFATQGHVGYPEAGVAQRTAELTQIPGEIIKNAVEQSRAEEEIVRDTPRLARGETRPDDLQDDVLDEPWLFHKPLFLAELGVARLLRQLQSHDRGLPPIDIDSALAWVEQKMKLQLAETQRSAIRSAAVEKVLVITGGPGVGKTTLVRGILEIFAAKGMRIGLCAPTGRAAKRLGEATGREARTIHRLLEFDAGVGGFARNRERPLDLDLLIVDEVSMVDIVLMNQVLRAVPPWASLVLVGDVDQLPSVGPGTVLRDLIASGAVPVVRLTQIFRQAEQSSIIRAAYCVHQGEQPLSAPTPTGDFFFIESNHPESILETVVAVVRDRIPGRFGLDPLRDVQLISPMNGSELGVRNLNAIMQGILNPAEKGKREVERFGWTFRVGDKVMQTSNNYQKEVFNGDIGRITRIEPVDQDVRVEFEGREVSYDFNELDELNLAFAISVHKSQGGEYPAVVIPLHTQHYMMLQRNLLYTAITRGKRLVVIVGSRRALSVAVQRHDTERRFSLLQQRLAQPAESDQSLRRPRIPERNR